MPGKLFRFLFMFLTGCTSSSVLSLFPLLITFCAPSTHLITYLSLEILSFIIRTNKPILVEPTDLLNNVIVFQLLLEWLYSDG